VFLLYPEGLLIPSNQPLADGNIILFVAALVAGSFLIGGLAGVLTAIRNKMMRR
jgi:hypothetical protein